MQSYQLLNAPCAPDVRRRIIMAAAKLDYLGLILLKVQVGRGITMIVYPNRATQSLESVYTGQGWEDGHFYKSYAAVLGDVTIVWRKPMRPPQVSSNVIPWTGNTARRVTR